MTIKEEKEYKQKCEEFRQKCLVGYNKDIELLPEHMYYNVDPRYPSKPREQIKPIVPKKTAYNNIMIVGEYPSAIFYNKKIPIGNIKEPFSADETDSGDTLDDMLPEVGIERDDCWITNLVKVFLFKVERDVDGKIRRRYSDPERKLMFRGYAEKSMKWLYYELSIANPKIIIALSKNVFDILIEKSYEVNKYGMRKICDNVCFIIQLPHPHNFLPFIDPDKSKWNDYFLKVIVPHAKEVISRSRDSALHN
jgi:uracil-DNA glycosylase